MAAPSFVPTDPTDRPRFYTSPAVVPDGWASDRPGDLDGRQPAGSGLGYQGPDQGYALLLAGRFAPKLRLQPGEHRDDVIGGLLGVALKRASIYGRAPVVHDLTVAATIWGFLTEDPPTELLAVRRTLFEGAGNHLHGYQAARAIADMVPVETLRRTPQAVAAAFPHDWKALVGI